MQDPSDIPTTLLEDTLLLGRYRVIEDRAEGGFASVKICWDRRLTRKVAIKCIPLDTDTQVFSASTLKEALQEARTSSMLNHPHIVTVHDFALENNTAYIVMEYIDGLNLEEFLSRVEGGILTPEECAHILESVSDALAFAHENGVLHLDVKPANIMIDRQGQVKLTDFGMATLASATGFEDSRGGTVGYMSPEQIRGELVDERCDVFSLACVLWKALSGKSPFVAADADASLAKIKRGPKPSLSYLNEELGGPVELTLLRAVAFDAQDRTVSVEDLADALIPYLGNPFDGKESLVYLLDQAQDKVFEDVPEEVFDKQALLERFTHAPLIFERALWFVVSFATTYTLLPAFGVSAFNSHVGVSALVGVIGAVAPFMSAVLLTALTSLAPFVATLQFDRGHTLEGLGLSVLLLLALGAFWYFFGRKIRNASLALFSSFASAVIFAPLSIAPIFLRPLPAIIATALSYVAYSTVIPTIVSGFTHNPWLYLFNNVFTLSFLISWVITALLGGLLSLSYRRSGRKYPLLVQNSALIIGISVQFASIWVENGHILPFSSVLNALFAVFLFELIGIATILIGPQRLGQEAEKHEFI